MGKVEISSRKLEIPGNISCKVGKIKNKNDLTEADEIKKRWQKYTELYKKDFHDPDNYSGVVTRLEPDILVCGVKWVFRGITNNKASGGDGITAELFQILNDDVVKIAAHNISANLENSTLATGLGKKKSIFIPIPKKGNVQECSNYHSIVLLSHASKFMLVLIFLCLLLLLSQS